MKTEDVLTQKTELVLLTALSSPFSIPIGGGWGDFPLNGVCRYG